MFCNYMCPGGGYRAGLGGLGEGPPRWSLAGQGCGEASPPLAGAGHHPAGRHPGVSWPFPDFHPGPFAEFHPLPIHMHPGQDQTPCLLYLLWDLGREERGGSDPQDGEGAQAYGSHVRGVHRVCWVGVHSGVCWQGTLMAPGHW